MNLSPLTDDGFADVLKQWRKRRRLSQLELSSLASISTRHISFLEKGRAKPSRDMVLKLGSALNIPPADINAALTVAGFAQAYPKTKLSDESVLALHNVVNAMLEKQMPWPAVACDHSWNVLNLNRSGSHLMKIMGLDNETNLMQAMLLGADKPEVIINWPEIAQLMLRRLDAEQLQNPDDTNLKQVRHQLASHPRLAEASLPETNMLSVVVPVKVQVGESTLSLISMIAHFGAVQEITYSGLHIELFFPADETTTKYFESV